MSRRWTTSFLKPNTPFMGLFFQDCWVIIKDDLFFKKTIIKDDLTTAFNQLDSTSDQYFNLLNTSNSILVPSKLDAKHTVERIKKG
jgi:hypothetical protein